MRETLLENHNMIIKNRTVERAHQMKEALEQNNATGVDFAGMTYAQFCSGVAPSFEKRELYAGSLMNAAGERQEIDNADIDTVDQVHHMRDAIRCHPDYGPNSALYVQCGYVADNQKKSGLTRPASEEQTESTEVEE
jgi:hypothetical protein